MGFTCVSTSTSWLAIAAETRASTRTGATAFKADTKSVPRNPASAAKPGIKYAVSVPKISATTICRMSEPPIMKGMARLKSVFFSFFIAFFSC